MYPRLAMMLVIMAMALEFQPTLMGLLRLLYL